MPRVYLPLLPLPVLAALVAISACTKARTEEVSHVIPPPAYAALAVEPKPAAPGVVAAPSDDKPSAEDVKAFNKKVMK